MLVGPGEADRRGRSPPGSSIVGEFRYALAHPKSPVLMAVMFIACAAIGLCLYPALSSRMIMAGALGAVIADAFPWRVAGFTVDDNLSIPLLSGALMWLAGFPQA
jgi:dolichol kinase